MSETTGTESLPTNTQPPALTADQVDYVQGLIAKAIEALPAFPDVQGEAEIAARAVLPTQSQFLEMIAGAVDHVLSARASDSTDSEMGPDGRRPKMTSTDLDSLKDWVRTEIHLAMRNIDIDQRRHENP